MGQTPSRASNPSPLCVDVALGLFLGYGSHIPRGCLAPQPSKTPLATLGWFFWGCNLAFQFLLPEGKPQSNSLRGQRGGFWTRSPGPLQGWRRFGDGTAEHASCPRADATLLGLGGTWGGWGGAGKTKLPLTQNVRTRMWCNVWGWGGSDPICCSHWSCTRLSRSPAASPAPILSLALVGAQSSWSSLHFHRGKGQLELTQQSSSSALDEMNVCSAPSGDTPGVPTGFLGRVGAMAQRHRQRCCSPCKTSC